MGNSDSSGASASYAAMTKQDDPALSVFQVLDVLGDTIDRHIRIAFEDISGARESHIDRRSVSSRLALVPSLDPHTRCGAKSLPSRGVCCSVLCPVARAAAQ
jgi:hypothetical protein